MKWIFYAWLSQQVLAVFRRQSWKMPNKLSLPLYSGKYALNSNAQIEYRLQDYARWHNPNRRLQNLAPPWRCELSNHHWPNLLFQYSGIELGRSSQHAPESEKMRESYSKEGKNVAYSCRQQLSTHPGTPWQYREKSQFPASSQERKRWMHCVSYDVAFFTVAWECCLSFAWQTAKGMAVHCERTVVAAKKKYD